MISTPVLDRQILIFLTAINGKLSFLWPRGIGLEAVLYFPAFCDVPIVDGRGDTLPYEQGNALLENN